MVWFSFCPTPGKGSEVQKSCPNTTTSNLRAPHLFKHQAQMQEMCSLHSTGARNMAFPPDIVVHGRVCLAMQDLSSFLNKASWKQQKIHLFGFSLVIKLQAIQFMCPSFTAFPFIPVSHSWSVVLWTMLKNLAVMPTGATLVTEMSDILILRRSQCYVSRWCAQPERLARTRAFGSCGGNGRKSKKAQEGKEQETDQARCAMQHKQQKDSRNSLP